jgi:hypothetical protein
MACGYMDSAFGVMEYLFWDFVLGFGVLHAGGYNCYLDTVWV